jgi:hypothetical protein
MSDLLDFVLDAHGGLTNWRKVTTIDLRLTMRGRLLPVKQQPQGLHRALVKISTRQPRTLISPFPYPGARGLSRTGQSRFKPTPVARSPN